MLKVEKHEGGALVVLSGNIDESDSLADKIGVPSAGSLRVSCKGVYRINSIGVKRWIEFFSLLHQQGVAVRFEEISTALVEQFNCISNFSCGAQVVSVMVPFLCSSCACSLVAPMVVSNLKQIDFKLPAVPCPKCGATAEFDDIAEEYFMFVERTASP